MRKSEILSRFNPNLNGKELQSIEDFIKLEKRVDKQTKAVDKMGVLIEKRNNALQQRLQELDIKVNSTLFGDRRFINESYAFEVPINEDFFEPSSSILFKDNILTTSSESLKSEDRIVLDINNLKSRRNTSFKFVDKILTIAENEHYNYQEVEVILPSYISSGYFYIEFNTYNSITILNKFGKEIVPKQVTNKIRHPISFKDKGLVLRFNSNTKKSIKILDFYITQESFNTASIIRTKPIAIGRSISQIGIFTCDNYSNKDIDISYKISINSGEYKEIRPLNKQKNLDINSIISTDFNLKEFKLKTNVKSDISNYYLIDAFDTKDFNLIKSFRYKLGDSSGYINTEDTIYINTKSEVTFKVAPGTSIQLNGELVEGGSEGKEVTLKKGFNSLRASLEVWNQRHNLLETTILSVEGSAVKFKDKFGLVNVVEVTNSIFYQLYALDIYSEKLSSKLHFVDNKVYISKGEEEQAYVFIKENKTLVNTVQLEIELKSLSKNIPPYISSLTIKAV